PTSCRGRWSVASRLTIRSSRCRFAARLNSGVRAHMHLFTRSSLKALGLFALVGPPFGALLWILASTGPAPYPQGFLESAWNYASTVAIAIPISWIFGLVPSVLTGLLVAASWSLLHGSLAARKLVRVAIGTFWGYVATYGFKWLAFG